MKLPQKKQKRLVKTYEPLAIFPDDEYDGPMPGERLPDGSFSEKNCTMG